MRERLIHSYWRSYSFECISQHSMKFFLRNSIYFLLWLPTSSKEDLNLVTALSKQLVWTTTFRLVNP